MRILVTGAGGFAGSHLVEHLLTHGRPAAEIHGVVHNSTWRLDGLQGLCTLHQLDLCDPDGVDTLIKELRPEMIFHLAAQSNSVVSFQEPWLTHEQNVRTQMNLLESARRWQPSARFLIVSSNAIYGLVGPEQLPISESCPYAPITPYGVSKATQELMALQYWRQAHIPTIIARSFNHLGPRQSADFVASAFARQLVEIELGRRSPTISVGNLAAERDFTDVRDTVSAYWSLMLKGETGQAYNVASGVAVPVRRLLDILMSYVSLPIEVIVQPEARASEAPRLVGDIHKLQDATGWRTQYTLENTLLDVINFWRQTLTAPANAIKTSH